MSKGIELSQEHGLNPSLDMCFWCGKTKGIALFGRIHKKKGDRSDLEAPKEVVTCLEPCDDCKEKFKLGVHLIEVSEDGSRFEGNENFSFKGENGTLYWPTGRYVVVRPESIKNGVAGSKMLCGTDVMEHFLSQMECK